MCLTQATKAVTVPPTFIRLLLTPLFSEQHWGPKLGIGWGLGGGVGGGGGIGVGGGELMQLTTNRLFMKRIGLFSFFFFFFLFSLPPPPPPPPPPLSSSRITQFKVFDLNTWGLGGWGDGGGGGRGEGN